MECQNVKQELVAFLDNEVPATLKAQIEAHLKGCPDCAQEMRALQASWQMLDRNLPPGPGPDFTASVMNRIRQTPQSSVELKPNWLEKFLPSLIVIAVILVVFLMGLLVWDHIRPTTKVPAAQLPTPSVEPEVQLTSKESQPIVPVASEAVAEPKEVIPATVSVPQAIQTLPEIKPVIVPQVAPMVPVAAVPMIAKVDKDRDIIANLDMYENAEMLKKMDVVADMDVVSSMKEKSS